MPFVYRYKYKNIVLESLFGFTYKKQRGKKIFKIKCKVNMMQILIYLNIMKVITVYIRLNHIYESAYIFSEMTATGSIHRLWHNIL